MFGKKKYSAKVKAQSQLWLEQNGLPLEQLTEAQQEEIHKLTKTKRALAWLVPISLIILFVYIGLISWGYQLIFEMKIDLAPKHYVVKGADGEENMADIPVEIQDSYNTFGTLLVILGLSLGGIAYSGVNCIVAPLASYFTYRRQKRMMLAFLPLGYSGETNHIELAQL